MTAKEFATLLDARCTGMRRWIARCPSHDDREPSLSIGEGQDGRVLLHCFRGCSLAEILAAQGLVHRDLFSGPPPSPEQLRKSALERTQRDAEASRRHAAHAAACERLQNLEAVCDALGARLAQRLDNDALAELFHSALNELRVVEAIELELRP
jgi:hypothetical protein